MGRYSFPSSEGKEQLVNFEFTTNLLEYGSDDSGCPEGSLAEGEDAHAGEETEDSPDA